MTAYYISTIFLSAENSAKQSSAIGGLTEIIM